MQSCCQNWCQLSDHFLFYGRNLLKDYKLTDCVCIYIRIPVSDKPKTGGFNRTYQKGVTEEAFRFSWY